MGAARTRKVPSWLAVGIGLTASAFVLGFLLFTASATRDVPARPAKADAIVVLTGGGQRIEEAARLLAQGYGKRLLISGVNHRSSRDDVQRLTGLDNRLFGCCVDLGYTALDTAGNADETMRWSGDQRFTSLIIVTASYHMPRSLAEIARALPGTRLVPYPVRPKSWRADPWYLNWSAWRVLVAEYLKFIPSAARLAVNRAIERPSSRGEAASQMAVRP